MQKLFVFLILGLFSILLASGQYSDIAEILELISRTLSSDQVRSAKVDALVGILSHADESWLGLLDEIPSFKSFVQNMAHEELATIDKLKPYICSAWWAIYYGNLLYDFNYRVNTPCMLLLRWALLADNDHFDFIKKALQFEISSMTQLDICSLKTPEILEEAFLAGRFENAAAMANLFDLKMSPELYEKLSFKFGVEYANKCAKLLEISHEQYRLFESIWHNDLSLLLNKLDAYEPCHIERLDGSTTLSILVCTADRNAGINERQIEFENLLAMIDDLLKEEQAVESAYLPFAGKSPITRAAESKDSRLLEVLCINNIPMAFPDGDNGTPLHVSLDLERLGTVEYLLETYKGPLNLDLRCNKTIFRSGIFSQQHPGGLTALDQAIQWDRPRFVWDLLSLGSPVVLEHYNLAKLSDGICQMLRIWSYFSQYMCWNSIEPTGGMTDVFKEFIWPILNDPEFLLANNINFVLRKK